MSDMDPLALSVLADNARDLELELSWLGRIVEARLKRHFSESSPPQERSDLGTLGTLGLPAPPDLGASQSLYAAQLRRHGFGAMERLALVLALVPYLRPRALDVFFTRNTAIDRRFTEFGGCVVKGEGDFVPTLETLAFLLGGDDLLNRFLVQRLFAPEHAFARHSLLRLAPIAGDDLPALRAPLRVSEELLALLTTGQRHTPDYGAAFPAQRIETRLDWSELVLHPTTRRNVEEIQAWIEHGETLLHDWGMARVPAELRNAPRLLSSSEFFPILKHPIHTAELLERLPGIPSMVPIIAYQFNPLENVGVGFAVLGVSAPQRMDREQPALETA